MFHFGKIGLTMAIVLQNLHKVKAEENSIMDGAEVLTGESTISVSGDVFLQGSFKSYF